MVMASRADLRMQLDSTRAPEIMTTDERRDEVASILARGLVRAVHASRVRISKREKVFSDSDANDLDSQGNLSLTVASQPAG